MSISVAMVQSIIFDYDKQASITITVVEALVFDRIQGTI